MRMKDIIYCSLVIFIGFTQLFLIIGGIINDGLRGFPIISKFIIEFITGTTYFFILIILPIKIICDISNIIKKKNSKTSKEIRK